MSQHAPTGRTYAGQPVADRQRQRRARFLDSGLTVFAREGYMGSSVGAICKDAGLSSRQFYEEFTGREALLLELYQQIDAEAREAVLAALADRGSETTAWVQRDNPAAHRPPEGYSAIDAAVRAYVLSLGSDPRRARVALVEVVGAGPRMDRMRMTSRRAWGKLLAQVAENAAAVGEIPPGDYELRMVAAIGAVHYVIDEWSVSLPQRPPEDLIAALLPVIRGALGGETAPETLSGEITPQTVVKPLQTH
ncbi:MAG: TetR/AcrR family transcriptional regulator [Mycobacterium sp.]|nr:TetR/AcrR family transcriptional regulator [Mycobacterium sp.]